MKKFILPLIVATALPFTAIAADAPDVVKGLQKPSLFAGFERELEAEKNTAYAGATFFKDIISVRLNADDATDANGNKDWGFAGSEIDVKLAINKQISVYLENDLDKDFEHTETKAGFKFSF